MLTEKDVTESRVTEKHSSESFLKGIIDFIKWTTTITVASVIWIGSQSHSLVGTARFVVGASMLAFLFSLIIAVITMRRVLNAWAADWNLAIKDQTFVLLKKAEAFGLTKTEEQRVEESINELLDAIDATRTYTRPFEYSCWISWHTGLLLLGLVLYVTAQIWAAL